jgi:hypothetical protein
MQAIYKLMAKYTSSNIFNKNNVKVIQIFDNDALLIKEKRKKEKNISGVISVVSIIEKYLDFYIK